MIAEMSSNPALQEKLPQPGWNWPSPLELGKALDIQVFPVKKTEEFGDVAFVQAG